MKSKKLISLICAAAMTTSAFAGLVTTASAAATPAWSFDGSSTDGWSGSVTPTVATDEGSTDQYLDFLAGTGTKCNDVTFALPAAAQLSDDYVLEYDAFVHTSNGMGRLAQYTQLAFTGANPVQDTQNYNDAAFLEAAAAVNPDSDHGWNPAEEAGWGYASDIVSSLTNRVELQGKMLINYDGTKAPSMDDGDAQIGDSRWVRVRNEVKDGKAKVTIADSNGTIVDGEEFAVSATKLTQIKMTFGRADTSYFIPTTPANIKLDNIKVYDGIAGTPAFSTSDLRKSPIVATPIPAPEKVAGPAPKFYAPESAENVYTANFNSEAVKTLASVETTAQDPVQVTNGMKVQVGSRDTGADAKTYASIVKVADGDNALRLSADKFSTNGRGPVVSLDDPIDLSDMTSGSAVMSFAVYLSKTDTNGIERLFLFDNTTNVDGNGCARDVVAVITTEDIQNEDESYKYTAGEANIGIHVEPEAWHTITVVATAGNSPVRLFVDGKYEADGVLSPALKLDMVGTGEGNKTAVTHLPMIGIENTKAYNEDSGDGGTVYSTALIDNVLTYFVQGELRAKNLPQTEGKDPDPTPTPQPKHNVTVEWDNTAKKAAITQAADDTSAEAFDAVLIHAAYDSKGAVTSVTTYDAKNITTDGIEVAIPETDVVHTGDKLMVWNSMKDMIPYGVKVVEDGAAPVVKYSVTVADTENGTVTVTPSGNVDANTEVEITAAPNEGYEVDTITVKDSANADVAVTGNKFTVVDKDVTVTVTFKEKYVAPATYTIAGTVDAGVLRVRLVDKADATNAIEATIADGKATAAGVKAGTYKIEVGYKGGSEADTITPASGEIEVTADNAEAFAVTSKESALPAITGTVTITGTPAVGETLTANVTGLNEGETATYEWRAKAEVSDAFVAIEGATASTLVLTEAMKGSQIKVVVKSEGTSGQLDSDPTAAVAGVKSAVTVAAATNGTVKVMNGTTELDAEALAAVEAGTELTITTVPDAGYELKTLTWKTAEGEAVDIKEAKKFTMPAEAVTVTVEFEAEPVVPYADGTITFDADSAETLFKDYSRVVSTVATATVAGNTTKVNSLASSGQSGAGYEKYSEAFKAKGDAIEVSFDVTKLNANSFLSVRTTKGGTANRNNDATGRIFTVGREGSEDTKLKIWGSGDVVSINDTDAAGKWYHIEAVINNTAKTTAIKVYNYKANNNYANETPIYQNATLGFRDNTADGVVGMDYYGALNGAAAEVDNVRFYDQTYVDPISVTATGATVDKNQAVTDDVITITPTVPAGQKLTAVKVNGTAIAANEGVYTYTVTGEEEAIAVTVEFARADATAIEISGAANVAIADGTSTYTAAVKAGETTVSGTVTWSVAAKDGAAALDAGTTINAETGVLTIANTQAATTVVITASTKKDVANAEDTAVVTATKEVALSADAVYNVTKGAETNGTFTVSAATATANDTITVVPTPASGYQVKEVSYTVGEAKTVVSPVDNAYTFTGLSGDATVNVEFEAITYTITNGYTAENGNSIAIDKTTATIGQDVVVTPTIAQGYKLSALTYTADGGEAVDILTAKTFKMPAGNVTINATFESFDGVYYKQDFSAADLDAATVLGDSALRSGARAAVGSIADGAYKWSIASDNKRSKAYTSMATPIDFSGDANIAFDLTLNPVGTAAKPTVAELTLGNSDHMALFAIRVDSENLAGGFSVYAGGKVNNSVGQNSEAGDIGTSKNNWGSNEYVWNISNAEGPAMTVLKKADESVLPYAKAKAYKVALSISGNNMTVTVTDSADATATATATLDVTGLKRDIKHFVAFLDQGSSSGGGSYISIDNISVKAPWSTAE